MVRSWVESRRRGREDPLAPRAVAAPVGGAHAIVAGGDLPAPLSSSPPAARVSPTPALPTRASALVSVIRGVGSPLQSAVSEVAAGLRERGEVITPADEARAFGQLVQQVVSMSRITSSTLDIRGQDTAPGSGEPLRWSVLEAVSDLVGAHYRAVGVLHPSGVVGQMVAAITQIAVDGARREDLMPGLGSATQARPGLAMLRAMPPVVHAVARYAFGRSPLVLVTEVAWELQYKAVDSTRRLLEQGATLDEWHAVYGAFVVAAGQQYAEAHFSEADRVSLTLKEAPADKASLKGGEQPMEHVWEAFDRKLETLLTFSGYMAPPVARASSAVSTALPVAV